MTTLKKRFWLWLGKVLRVDYASTITYRYLGDHPLTSPVQDPFQITEKQKQLAAQKALKLPANPYYLTRSEARERNILQAIFSVSASQDMTSQGLADQYLDKVSNRSIEDLMVLGFRDNADIQRYLSTGELPHG